MQIQMQVQAYEKKIKDLELLNQILLEKVAQYTVKSKLLSYGKENLDYITDINYIKLCKYPTLGMVELFKLIYLNDKHPENHIIKVDDHLLAYQEGEWHNLNIDIFIYPLVNKLFAMIDKYYKDNIKDTNNSDMDEKMSNLRYRIENKDNNCYQFFKEEIISVLSRKN